MNESEKCKESVRYFAENYLRLIDKEGNEYYPDERIIQRMEWYEEMNKKGYRVKSFLKGRSRNLIVLEKNKLNK